MTQASRRGPRFAGCAPLSFLLFLLLTTGSAGGLPAQEEGLRVGAPAPVVTVPDLDGKAVDLGRYIGRQPVLIEFWATWCPICEELLPRLRAARERFGDRVHFVGINVTVNETREGVRRYLARHPLPFAVLYDDQGTSVRAYDALGTSYIVIIDAGGRVAYTGMGTGQRFEQALERVTTE